MWISIILICLVGTSLHFLYEISHHNKYVALFAAVNESTWEHIKIALTPMFLYGLYDGFKYGMLDNYFIAKSLSLLVVIIIIPLIFYTYTTFTKKAILIIDIITFCIAIIGGQLTFNYVINLRSLNFIYSYLGVIILFIIFGFYMIATLLPFENFIFKDPISKKYGIKGHTDTGHKH